MWKMSIQYLVPGFELTTFWYESLPLTTRPGLPPNLEKSLYQCLFVPDPNDCKAKYVVNIRGF